MARPFMPKRTRSAAKWEAVHAATLPQQTKLQQSSASWLAATASAEWSTAQPPVLTCRRHELGGQAQLAVGAGNSQRGDVAVHLCRLLLPGDQGRRQAGAGGRRANPAPRRSPARSHFGQHVAHYLAVIILRDVEQLGPGEHMVEVILRGRATGWVRPCPALLKSCPPCQCRCRAP